MDVPQTIHISCINNSTSLNKSCDDINVASESSIVQWSRALLVLFIDSSTLADQLQCVLVNDQVTNEQVDLNVPK